LCDVRWSWSFRLCWWSLLVGGDDSDPAATIESYIDDYYEGFLDVVMSNFTEDSVITDHPTDFGSLSTGLDEIRLLHVQDLSFQNDYVISNVETSGDTVTWDSVWGLTVVSRATRPSWKTARCSHGLGALSSSVLKPTHKQTRTIGSSNAHITKPFVRYSA